MIVISPHLDDAVFSCGAALAAHPGSTVVTVFAGLPVNATVRTDWDARCGFDDAALATQARRSEDTAALALLAAEPRWLGFVDGQYGEGSDEAAVAAALRHAVLALDDRVIAYPLGLFHADHRLVHRAARAALDGLDLDAFAYEDAIYRAMPGLLDARLAELAAAGVAAEPANLGAGTALGTPAEDRHADAKARAVRCYASQLPALGADGMADAARPERCWRLIG